ncbi:hypothetical protein [Clostridium sp. ZS2-4]|uniref:hypothetical protein n=1 Tax=Clostridium sp. ZS2-4 TaxID=2987703 RepID=UPI00227D197F|nr:hypothetical protein [Clostridium sp. ZS2-4]MCY6354474.1 hypothetical protein [Clostridium sp. ZS2-4]
MNFSNTIIPLFFIAIILKQLRYIKELIIPTRKSYVEVITILKENLPKQAKLQTIFNK